LITVGRRWDNLKEVWYGENQGLALLELPGEFFEDIESHKLHPALLDSATAFLIDSLHSREAYLPFSYKRVKIKGPLPAKVYSYARLVEKDPSQKQALEFNITIMDETGKELIDIERLTVLAISKEKKENNEQLELVTPASLESVRSNPLKDAILSHEGVEVFERILSDTLPQAVVSTADFLLRLEKAKYRRTPGLAETPDEESGAGPGHPRPELSTSYVAPKTGIQKILAAIWQEYLGIREIGIHDDFFELGADSIKSPLRYCQDSQKIKRRSLHNRYFQFSHHCRSGRIYRRSRREHIHFHNTSGREGILPPLLCPDTSLFSPAIAKRECIL